jgi:hypothetical protein
MHIGDDPCWLQLKVGHLIPSLWSKGTLTVPSVYRG